MLYQLLAKLTRKVLPAPATSVLQAKVHARRNARNQAERAAREAYWRERAGTNGYVCDEISAGVRIHLPFDSELGRLIYLGGYEENERCFVRRVLRKGDIFVDVGANIGLYTLIAARLVGSKGAVHAFEPVSKTYQRLVQNVRLNGFRNVECHQLGLSSAEGWDEITTCTDGFDAWSSFGVPAEGTECRRESVPTTTWDAFSATWGLRGRVKLMKIDIEGWEGHFLSGAALELSAPTAPDLLIEFNDKAAQAAGLTGAQVYRMLEGFGYQMFHYEGSSNSLIPESLRPRYDYLNLVATKRPERVQQMLNASRR